MCCAPLEDFRRPRQDGLDTQVRTTSLPDRPNPAISLALRALSRRPAGLFSDIDGTISAIAPTPAEAKVDPLCREALRALSQSLSLVAVVSGRSAGEALSMVGLPQIVYVGNHGLETWENGRLTVIEDVRYFREILRSFLDRLRQSIDVQGVLIQSKGLTASVHYRQANDPEETRGQILDTIAANQSDERFLITEGRMIVEIRPPIGINKGTAVAGLVCRNRLEGAVYLGDDLTDLDAFKELNRLEQQGRLTAKASIAVKATESPREVLCGADATVEGVEGAAQLLKMLSVELG